MEYTKTKRFKRLAVEYLKNDDAMNNDWIKSKDRLPETDALCIVSGGVAYYRDGVWRSATFEAYPGSVIQWEVKYWAWLPETPED